MVRGAVPSRSSPHAARDADTKEFHLPDLWRRGYVDAAEVYRLDDRAGEKTSGQRTCHLRAFRRCGFIGGCGAGRPSPARLEGEIAPDLHLCEQRRAAQEWI